MPVLDALNLKKSLGTRVLLQNVNFTIVRGEKVGLVGDNGAGKSTLGKILAGLLEADQGEVRTRKGASVSYLAQDPELPAGQTAEQVALSGISEWQAASLRYQTVCTSLAEAESQKDEAKVAALLTEQEQLSAQIERLGGWNRQGEATRILNILGITDPHQDVGTMSGGERRRVALARLLIEKPDLAILDEPTNHLDADTIEWLEEYLQNDFPGATLLITHDRWLLNAVVDRTFEVSAGNVYSYVGGWEAYLLARDERRSQEERKEANRQNFLRKEIEWLRRQPKARTGKQKARIDRAEDAIAQKGPEQTRDLRLGVEETRLGGNILETRDLAVAIGDRDLIHSLDFHLTRGKRVGIVGKSGAGKTTLLRTLLGELPPKKGEIIRGKNTEIAYLDQMRGGLDPNDTVYDAVTGGRPSVTVGETDISSYSYLRRFRFEGDVLRQKVAGLSGGEKSRLALARLLLSPANVLVLDEPTNDLDVMTLGALEEMLLALTGAALIVSHDRYFLDRVATSVLALDGQGGAHHLQGGYSVYSEFRTDEAKRKKQNLVEEKARIASISAPADSKAPKKKSKLTYAEEIELASLLGKIEQLGEEVAVLEEKMGDPTLYTERREQAAQVEKELSQKKQALSDLESRWLELEEKKEGLGV